MMQKKRKRNNPKALRAYHHSWNLQFSRQLILGILITGKAGQAQEPGAHSLTGNASAEARAMQEQAQPYTIKTGDFRLLAAPSLGVDWNDSINLSEKDSDQDFIVKPNLQLTASYPLTAHNVLRLNVGVGYDWYIEHSNYSGLRLSSQSEVAFDVYVKDFWFNFHDRFSYTRASSGVSAVAGTGEYGGFDNSAGLNTTWDLKEVTLTLGYDHQNFISSSKQFEYTDRATEVVSTRAGFRVHPQVTTGLEGSAAFTTYDQTVLNNNVGYNMGVYADWRPGHYLSIQPRVGYSIYNFDQTSHSIRAVDQDGWYAAMSLSHAITDAITYSLSVGHELKLGIQADSTEDTYVRPSVSWKMLKDFAVNFSLFYENGKQGNAKAGGGVVENYDHFGGNIGFSHAVTKKLSMSLNYQLTMRNSNADARNYTQNVVGLNASYSMQ